MSLKYLIKEQTLKNMANTIRSKIGTTEPMNTVEMVEAIANIPSSTEMTNATATEDKVLEGYTFYAGEGGLKTGGMTAESLGITSDKIISGETIMGVEGSVIKGVKGSISITSTASKTIDLGFKPTYFMLFGGGQDPWMNYYECFNSSGSITNACRTLCGTTSDAGQQYKVSYSGTKVTVTKVVQSYNQYGTFSYLAY